MQMCTHCQTQQPFENFHKGKAYKHGYRTWCKTCMAAYKKQYKAANRESILKQQRAYDAVKNTERREYFRQWHLKNRERNNAQKAEYRKNNPHKHAAKEMRRRLAKTNQTPSWLSVDAFWMIEQAYELAALRTKMLGVAFEVDHILPLQGKLVSGLHVPENLQVIPATLNRAKSNSFEVAS